MDNAMTYLERWKECHKEGDRATAANIMDNRLEFLERIEGNTLLPKESKTLCNNVDHPQHYISKGGIETIDVIDAWTEGLDGIVAVDTANVIKYISRWNKKNGIEDLKKAQWYLNHLISEMERRMKEDSCIR